MAFKMKAGKEGPMKKNFPGAFKDVDKTVKKGDKEYEGMKAAKDKINKTARSVNTPGVAVSGETLASARKRVQDTKKAYKASGAFSSEDKKRYKAMGLTNAKQMFNQKVKENEAAKRKTGQN